MNIRVPKFVLSLGAVALAALAFTLMAPQRAHAVASALVQLTNTLTNPGVTEDVSKQAGQMIDLVCGGFGPSSGTAQCYPATNLGSSNYTTPPNESLVVTSVDITGDNAATWGVLIRTSAPTVLGTWIGAGGNTIHFSYPQGLVVPPNSSVFALSSGSGSGQYPTIQLMGYLTYQ
jgi:hypothetical protein